MEGIVVKNLTRDFAYYEKEAGMKSSVKNLFHRTKQVRHAVKNISFEIQKGEMVGFLGPNGAGKTTTIKTGAVVCCVSQTSLESGRIYFWKR